MKTYETLHQEIKDSGQERIDRVGGLEKYATYLIRGGCPDDKALDLLRTHAITNNETMDVYLRNGGKKVLTDDLDYAFRRANIECWEGGEKSFADQLREWILTENTKFSLRAVRDHLRIHTKSESNRLYVTINRFVKQGLIKPTGDRGWYTPIEVNFASEDWKNADDQIAKIWLPFDLDQIAIIPYGSIIILSGASGAGKTATLLNIVKENQRKFDLHYFSSEISPGAFKRRINKFADITPDMWDVNFYNRSSGWEDVIKTGNNAINIIDYIELHDDFFKVGKYIHAIHESLNGAIAICAIQKNTGNDYGLGGQRTIEKAELAIALDHGQAKLTKIREFNLDYCQESPRNKIYRFKLVDGCRFVKVQGWHIPVKEF